MYINVRIDIDVYECGNLHIYVDTSKFPNAGKGPGWCHNYSDACDPPP